MPKNYSSKMPMHKMRGGHMMKDSEMPKAMPPKGMPMKPKKSGKK